MVPATCTRLFFLRSSRALSGSFRMNRLEFNVHEVKSLHQLSLVIITIGMEGVVLILIAMFCVLLRLYDWVYHNEHLAANRRAR